MTQSFEPSPSTVDLAELPAVVEKELRRHFSSGRRIVRCERRPSPERSSFTLDELDVEMDDGNILMLLHKDLSWRALSEAGRKAKPKFLYDPLREIAAYRQLLAGQTFSAPIYFGSAVDAGADRYWLFLERVQGQELYKIGDFSVWKRVAGWLAGMHAFFAIHLGSLHTERVPLIHHDGAYYRQWLRRALDYATLQESLPVRSKLSWLAERYESVVDRLIALPATIIHGEFYASNVLIAEPEGNLRICAVDWEMVGLGPGLIDLAALVSGKWTDEEKTALASAYYAPLDHESGAPWSAVHRNGMPSEDQEFQAFLTALAFCRLHLAVQWLGWSASWSPPLEHRHDWLAEAMRLAEELGL